MKKENDGKSKVKQYLIWGGIGVLAIIVLWKIIVGLFAIIGFFTVGYFVYKYSQQPNWKKKIKEDLKWPT